MDITAFIHNELAYADSQAGIETDPPLNCEAIAAIAKSTPNSQQVGKFALYTMMATGVLAATASNFSQAAAFTPEIAELQELLASRGFDPGSIDGTPGPSTRDAIAEAQNYYGITVDGVVGPETLAALQSDPYVAPGISSTSSSISVATDAFSSDAMIIGASVSEVQTLLADRGFYFGGIDGIAGPRTAEAIAEAQFTYGLTIDGIAGPNTIAALRADQPSSGVVTGDVAELQTLLADRGFYFGGIDGIVGPLTNRAILDAQEFYGLDQDGIAGPLTIAALRSDSPPVVTDPDPEPEPEPDPEPEQIGIEAVQALLKERGFYTGEIDGVEGPNTIQAIRNAQAFYGLVPDGIAGPRTISALTFDS
jgi:peptidoglycan hydrolase-like protein with peptidoglycan-binding domain